MTAVRDARGEPPLWYLVDGSLASRFENKPNRRTIDIREEPVL
jgi:hypothetical protein